jgi:hypothetical protein
MLAQIASISWSEGTSSGLSGVGLYFPLMVLKSTTKPACLATCLKTMQSLLRFQVLG